MDELSLKGSAPTAGSACTTFVELLRWRASLQADQKAYTFLSQDDEELSLTYAELDRQARAIGAMLQRQGATGERVLLLYPEGPEYIASFFGCLYAGALAVPAYPPYSNHSLGRLSSIVVDAQAKFVITHSQILPKIASGREQAPSLHSPGVQWITTDRESSEKDETLWQMPQVVGNTIAFLQYTSGSTATPKGVMVSHSNLLSNHRMLQCAMAHPAGVPFVSWLPLFHDMGLTMHMLQALYVGSPCILLPPSIFIQSPFRWLEAISLYQAHTSGAPNFAYDLCVEKITPEQRDKLDLSHWKFASCAAEPVRFQTLMKFAEYFAPCGFRIEAFRTAYGLAEATVFVTSHRPGLPPIAHHLKQEALERHQVILWDRQTADPLPSPTDSLTDTGEKSIAVCTSCGRTELDARVVIADPETGVRSSPGTVGEIWVAGSHVAQGYWNRNVETEATFQAYLKDTGEGPFLRTGDLGFLLDGDLFVTGRLKDLIIIRGRNLYPQDIEQVVEKSHSLLRRGYCAAFAVEESRGEQLVIVQEVVRHYDDVGIQEAIQAIRQAVLWAFDVEVAAVELLRTGTIPKTSSGKIQRRACRSRFLQGDWNAIYRWNQSQVHHPGTKWQEQDELSNHILDEMQKKIWAQVLELERVGSSDNFFVLGGHSLLAQRLLTRIQEVFQVEITLTDLLEAPTPSAFAELVARKRVSLVRVDEGEAPSLPTFAPDLERRYEPFPTTDVQQAYWVGRYAAEGGNVGNHAYIEVEATDLDLKRFQWALQRLIERHEMLRAVLLPDGQQQVLKQISPFEIKMVDLRGQESDEQASQLEQIRHTLDHQLLPVDRWPAFELWISRLDDRQVRLHLSIESIFIDAWSMNTLIHEFIRLYHEPDLSLPKPSLSFRDYILAEASLQNSAAYQRAREYWLARLSSLPPAPELPLVPETERTWKRPQFVHREARLERAQWQRLKTSASQIGVTPSGVLLTAFSEVIACWSKTARFSLNLSTFNRLPLHPQVNEIVGDFTSLLVLAVDHTTPVSFEERAKRLQEQLWQDLDHSSYSGIAVLRELVKMQGEGMKAVMPIVFTSLLIQDTASPLSPPWGKTLYGVTQTPQVWLDHQVLEVEGDLVFHWQSVDTIFPPSLIDDMFAAYCQLLQRLLNESWSEEIRVLLPGQQLALLAQVNATEAPISDKLLHTLFLEQVRQRPEQLALISPTRRLTYKQVYIGALQLAQQLRDWGACPNQLVGVVMEKGWEQAVAVLGILLSGAAYLPIDASLPRERLWYLLKDGQVEVVATQSWIDRRAEWPKDVKRIWVDSLDLDEEDIPVIDSIQGLDDLAYVIYTSGSTGMPKGVMIEHRGAVNTILDINQRFHVSSTDRVLALSALHFDLSVYDIFGLLAAGGTIVMPPEDGLRDPAIWMDLLIREQITIWNTVPALLQMLVDYFNDLNATNWQQTSLRLALLSGDWIPLSLPERIKEALPELQVISLGGATEASIWSILYPIECVEPSWKGIPYGQPMCNQQFFVLNEQLEPCPVWVAGHLYIGGIGLARGYWCDEEKTQASFFLYPRTGERLYRTGDMGRYLPDGNIEFLGREDLQVKIAGHRIELGEIEATLLDHPLVREAVVMAIGQAFEKKHLIAYVVPSEQAQWLHRANQTDDAQEGVNWEELVMSSQVSRLALSEPNVEDAFLDVWQILQQMYVQAVCKALNDFGVFCSSHERYSLDELMQKCAIPARYKKWVKRNMHLLVENGYLQQENGLFKCEKSLPTIALGELWEAYQKAATRLTDPTGGISSPLQQVASDWYERSPLLPAQTMENLKSILTEELHSAEIYLSTETSEGYRIFHYSNTILQILMQEVVRLTSERKKIRVLEIGAGFGTATAFLLPTLPRPLTEYIYTDISPYFLQEAQAQFAAYPFVEYKLLDIEKNPQSQGYEMHDFDVIVAASVLHATANIEETLTHVRSLLKPHGILLLLEETHFHQIFDLTMGLQQGFDRFEDTELRQSHPLLSRDMWHEALREQGFTSSVILNGPGTLTDFLGFDVILAQGPAQASQLRLTELYDHLRSNLPEYMIPARILPLETLPLTSNGKVDRQALPQPLIQPPEHTRNLSAARTPTEQALVHLWSEILNQNHVGIEENFLKLGGDSLLATKLLARIRADFNIEVPFQVLFKNPTVAALAEAIEQAHAQTATVAVEEEEGVL